MPNKLVWVTGAHGFLGRHVAREYAKRRWTVVGIGHGDWAPALWKSWGIEEWHHRTVNLDSLAACDGNPDLIVHCAGSSSVGFSFNSPFEDFQKTVASTMDLLEFVRLRSIRAKIVYPSSTAVYGSVPKGKISEDTALNPISPYGTHKMIAEHLLKSYSSHFGINGSIIRFFSIYGNGLTKQLLWDLCSRLSEAPEQIALYGTGNEIRDLLHIDDAVRLILAASETVSAGCPSFNGGSGTGITVREIAEEVRNAFHSTCAVQFNGIARKGDPRYYQADTKRAESLGWKPQHPWREGVKEYVAWFKETHNLK
ncbi:MAG TPA: NAD(P)-dependent oxidoreductase [Nitrospiria bacterium]|nr:NAD(P)-dependent oxidoreductase [Nitrospiria bacterium]